MTPSLGRRTAALVMTLAAVAGCGGSSTSSAAPTPLVLPSAAASTPDARASAGLPPEAPAVQGGKYYAVFLALAADAHDDLLVRAQDRAKALGYEGGVGDVGCTPGAREQLHVKGTGSYTAFSVLFATRAQAQQLAAAYGRGVVGIAYVSVGCLD